MNKPASIKVTLVYSPASRQVEEIETALPAGSTASAALAASGLLMRWPELANVDDSGNRETGLTLGIWGRIASVDQVLRDQDRVEIYRPLKVDPKVARRERFAKQGAKKKAGLFAKRRVGAKPGY